jgi:hypothetical protein
MIDLLKTLCLNFASEVYTNVDFVWLIFNFSSILSLHLSTTNFKSLILFISN